MTDRERRGPGPLEPLAPVAPDEDLTGEQREQIEREMDLLVDLWAAWDARRPDSPAHTDPHLLDWLTRELRARPPVPDDGEEEAVRVISERVRRRLAALRAPIARVDQWPGEEQAPMAGRIADVLGEAARGRRAPKSDLAIAAGAGRELWEETCERWIPLPADMPDGRYLALRVAGDSMTPLLHDGDVILVRLGSDVTPGAVVVARRPDAGYVVKQVGRLGRAAMELLSLNPAYEPLFVAREEGSVLGTVVLRWCGHDERIRRRM